MATRTRKLNRRHCAGGTQSGFTILEMTVSMAILAIVMGSIYGLLHLSRSGRINTTQRAEVLQGVRTALNAMGRDAINAGVGYPNVGALIPDNKLTLVGAAADSDTTAELLTPVYAANNVNTVNGTATDEVTFLYIDDTFNGGASLPISTISDSTGNNTLLTIQTGFNNSPCNLGDLYLITGTNGSAIGMLTSKTSTNQLNFASTDPLGINAPGSHNTIEALTAPASLLKLIWVSYYVLDEDANGTGTGTIERRVFGGYNTGNSTLINWVDQPLAFGVENMQIQYVLVDGSVVDLPSSTQMDDIRQIRTTITVRSPDIDPKTNQPFRTSMTSSFSMRNLVYEKL
jgi:prepilin-type N-terminal cleavage/methylation domain-containing protein